jgi:hypothetical protein
MRDELIGLLLIASASLMTVGPRSHAAGDEAHSRPSSDHLTRPELIQDIRQLNSLLETAHPDPYANGGGKVAYHRRLQQLIEEMPASGLSRREFHEHLQRFIARIGDAHTFLPVDDSSRVVHRPGGLPLFFEVVEDELYVSAVTDEEDLPLIGSLLVSVEGVPFSTLAQRQSERRGHDSYQHVLSGMCRDGSLFYRESLKQLVPEWRAGGSVKIGLRHPSGVIKEHRLRPSGDVEYPLHRRQSRIELPDQSRWLAWHFLDADRKIAFLRIDNMTTYREWFEHMRSVGSAGYDDWARQVYGVYHEATPPANIDEVIQGLPSATESFRGLLKGMKQEQADILVVDLRRNFGGNSLMIQILLYFLVGLDETVSLGTQTGQIQKLSNLLDESTESGIELDTVPCADRVPLTLDDYDFSKDSAFMATGELSASFEADLTRHFERMPSFYSVFRSRKEEALYRPDRIFVLSGNETQSSGFDLMTALDRLGAVMVGVSSSQSGNHFGNIRSFELRNSGLEGYVSTKSFVAFPDKPMVGYIRRPDHLLTYEKLASYDFDENATLLYALDIIGGLRR